MYSDFVCVLIIILLIINRFYFASFIRRTSKCSQDIFVEFFGVLYQILQNYKAELKGARTFS